MVDINVDLYSTLRSLYTSEYLHIQGVPEYMTQF